MVEAQTQDNKTVPVQDAPKVRVTLGKILLADREARTKSTKEIIDNFLKPIISKTENVLSRVELGNLVPTPTLGKQQDRNRSRG